MHSNPFLDTIGLGDCVDLLPVLPPASVDAVVCDPPYGLGPRDATPTAIQRYLGGALLDVGGDFMGANWQIPPVTVWRECLRALRPGGYLASFAGPRTWDIMSAGISAAGFVPCARLGQRFGVSMLQWIYGSGFPKSMNISKAVRKRAAKTTDREEAQRLLRLAQQFEGYGTSLKPAWEPILIFTKPGATMVEPAWSVPFLYCAKASRRERTLNGRIKNGHPCVKPLALARWLLRLLVPAGGVVLDPYVGSGTTVHAAIVEGRHYVGIERESRFHRLSLQRASVVHEEVATLTLVEAHLREMVEHGEVHVVGERGGEPLYKRAS